MQADSEPATVSMLLIKANPEIQDFIQGNINNDQSS